MFLKVALTEGATRLINIHSIDSIEEREGRVVVQSGDDIWRLAKGYTLAGLEAVLPMLTDPAGSASGASSVAGGPGIAHASAASRGASLQEDEE